jgi:heterodisulfide reductase subunit A
MYTAKQAMLYKHAVHDGQAYVFYMDIRADGKGYEEFIQRAMEEDKVLYIRGRVSKIFRKGDKLMVWGIDTLSGNNVEIPADLVVLAVALVPSAGTKELAEKLGVAVDENGFMAEANAKLGTMESSTSGIYLAGMVQGLRDIPDSVQQAGGAASKVLDLFAKDEILLEPALVAATV